MIENNLETERKYLIKKLPDNLEDFKKKNILQGYIIINEKTETRIRKIDNEQYLTTTKNTINNNSKELVREEIEENITKELFEELWPKTEGKRIEKTRYIIPYNNLTIELDIFKGKNEGLILSEIEFHNKADLENFKAPDWFGKDVSKDKQYNNKNLAK